jgi:uncharacterized membrane protein HdeD (DUF308 family)
MYEFISGAIMTLCFTAALIFARFWRRTHDRLFVWFALAFCLFGIERIVLAIVRAPETSTPAIYLFRLLGFLLIIGAIVDKNRKRA